MPITFLLLYQQELNKMRQPLFRSVNYLIVSYVPFVSPLNSESETQWDKKCLEGKNIVYNFADEKTL